MRFPPALYVSSLLLFPILASCSGGSRVDPFDTIGTHADPDTYDTGHRAEAAPWETIGIATDPQKERHDQNRDGNATETRSADTERRLPSGRIRINPVGHLWEVFNDSNKHQYAAAEKIGIAPITGVADAYFTRRPLVRISSNDAYDVDSLTHSMPFLVPEAAELLRTIGTRFNEELRKRGGAPHHLRVTSLLRSAYAVKKLRRVNRNATDSSTHQFGTTFDISYARFNPLDSTRRVSDEDLKNLLAEILLDLRNRGKCLVKYERHSPCFHITATGR